MTYLDFFIKNYLSRLLKIYGSENINVLFEIQNFLPYIVAEVIC